MSGDLSVNQKKENPLNPDEWCLAILVAYECGCGLTDKAKAELREAVIDPNFRKSLVLRFFDFPTDNEPGQPQNYGELFMLQNPMEFPPDWFNC